jgi:hypothetical protein
MVSQNGNLILKVGMLILISLENFTVFGEILINITIDKNYTLGGSGYLQNPNEIGHGYKTKLLT